MNPDTNRFDQWDARVAETAAALEYPATPNLAPRLRAGVMPSVVAARQREARTTAMRRVALAIAAITLIVLGLLAVPQVRAAVVEFLRIGAVQITLVEPTPTPTPTPQPTTTPAPRATATITPTATPPPTSTSTPLTSVLDLSGQTTLTRAEALAGFRIKRPTYPSDLGEPDAVFVQDLGGEVIVLVWMDKTQPDHVRLSLHQYGGDTFAEKGQPRIIQATSVNGRHALWTEGPYVQRLRNGNLEFQRLIEGHVLIWTSEDGKITYRLETDLPIEEAVKIAESLR